MRTLDPAAYARRDVLLLAPHPDDEAIGAGGTVALLARAGAKVLPVVLTGGEAGVDGTGRTRVEARSAESERACEILGTAPPRFLALTSQELREDPGRAAARLAERVGRAAFDVLLVPAPFERHATHRAALLAALLSECAKVPAEWWGYGVWDAVPAVDEAAEVDVTAARAAKAEAIAAHGSQNQARSLAAGIAARDMYQAIFSRITGQESRRAVERLLDLSGLVLRVRGEQAESARDSSRARRAVAEWTAERAGSWAAALWG